MPSGPICSVCSHPSRKEIETKLVAGASERDIARQHDFSHHALNRHRRHHVQHTIDRALAARDVDLGGSILERLRRFQTETIALMESTDNDSLRLKAIARLEAQLRIEAELTGAFQRSQENQSDRAHQSEMYESMVLAAIQAATEIGRELSREQAISLIKQSGYGEITRYLN